MNVSRNYTDGRRVFVHGAFSWLSGTFIFVEVKGQVYLCVLNSRMISFDKIAPGNNSSYLGKKYKSNFGAQLKMVYSD
jgi:hypothetical protein